MKAIVMHERGGAEVLRYETVPTPKPLAKEVLIKVEAATVNHTDIFHRNGQFFIQKRLPHILGMDVAGEIVEMGADLVIDRHSPQIVSQVMAATQETGATLVLDLVGKATLQSSIQMLSRNGRIICAGTLSGDLAEIDVMDLIMKNSSIKGCFDTIKSADYQQILQLFADETFQPAIDLILPLSEARTAHERIEAKQGFGKIILVPFVESN